MHLYIVICVGTKTHVASNPFHPPDGGWNFWGFLVLSRAHCKISISILIWPMITPLPKSPLDSTLCSHGRNSRSPVFEDPVKRWSLIWEEDKASYGRSARPSRGFRSRRSVSYKYEKRFLRFFFFRLFFVLRQIGANERCSIFIFFSLIVDTKLLLFFYLNYQNYYFNFTSPLFTLNGIFSRLARLVHYRLLIFARANAEDGRKDLYLPRNSGSANIPKLKNLNVLSIYA